MGNSAENSFQNPQPPGSNKLQPLKDTITYVAKLKKKKKKKKKNT